MSADSALTMRDRAAMIRAGHKRYLARIALAERVAARVEAQHAEPVDLDAVTLLWREPTVQPRGTGAL